MKQTNVDVLIVGGGVTGTAFAYVLSHYTSTKSIALIEMGPKLGAVNTDPHNNSQTLHDGSIETNYDAKKAASVFAATNLLVKFLHDYAVQDDVFSIGPKMVIGVGAAEVSEINNQYQQKAPIYGDLQLLDRHQIYAQEPKVIEGRLLDEPIMAISHEGYTIDFRKLSELFIRVAKESDKLQICMDTEAIKVSDLGEKGYVITDQYGNTFSAKVVVFATGPHSLLFAKELGYAKHLGLLPVAGSFFSVPGQNLLNGKVYTVQKPKLPFAAVHGDPEIFDHKTTRFGPTAKVLPMLIRHKYSTVIEFFKVSVPTYAGIATLVGILADTVMFGYMAKNLLYDLPILGKWFFLKQVQKIIPNLKYSDLKYNSGSGGIRPQIVNTKTMTLEMGDAQVLGRNVIFNVTPSPGASVCLANAYKDAKQVCEFLGAKFYYRKWEEDHITHPEHVELEHQQ
jgi:malate dehydrogenase (quinone)